MASDQDKRSEKEKEILQTLYLSPYESQKARIPSRLPGTCEWFVNHQYFENWHKDNSSNLLWVIADPGCGKSVLVKYLADHVLPTSEDRTTCYFFFNQSFEDQRSITNALCCIVHQLLRQKRIPLNKDVLRKFYTSTEFTYSFGGLWDILTIASQEDDASEIVCLFDSVDECDAGEMYQFLHALHSISGNCKLKFLLTSRRTPEIQQKLRSRKTALPIINLGGETEADMEEVSAEIETFIKTKIEDLGAKKALTDLQKDLLFWKLVGIPDRTYLWVYLTMEFVETALETSKGGILEVSANLPRTVDEIYERVISKSSDIKKATRLLHIIATAERALTLTEMNVALLIQESHKSYVDLHLELEGGLEKMIKDLCGLIVTIVDSRVCFFHRTAKDFLVWNGQKRPFWKDSKLKVSLSPQESHRILAEICTWHLLFAEFEKSAPSIDAVNNYVFLDYSAKYWATHFLNANAKIPIATLLKICDGGSRRFVTWFRIYWTRADAEFPEDFNILIAASYLGFDEVVEYLLRVGGVDLEYKDETYGQSAISWAAGNGFDTVVKQLIKGAKVSRKMSIRRQSRKGADVDSRDKDGRTALSYAAWNGHADTVKLLLKAGATIDSADHIGGTPLSYAICRGHEQLAKMLIDKGAKIQSTDTFNTALLCSAAQNGDEAVVRLLLDKGANPTSKDITYGQAPISWAAENGHEAVLKLLIDRGADLESKSNCGQTPLSWAAESGHVGIMRLLLDGGAKIESKNDYGQTPLAWAAENGNDQVVKMLLDHGANPNPKDNRGHTPIRLAIDHGHEAVAKLLYEGGADPRQISSIHSIAAVRSRYKWIST